MGPQTKIRKKEKETNNNKPQKNQQCSKGTVNGQEFVKSVLDVSEKGLWWEGVRKKVVSE